MAGKYMKRSSASLFTRYITKTTIGSYHTLTRKTKIKKTNNTKCWKEYITGTLIYYLLGY